MGLVLEMTLQGLLLLTEVIAGASFNIHENTRKTDPFKIGPVFPIEGFTAGAHKPLDTRTFKAGQHRFKVFVILDGDGFHSEGPGHLAGIAYGTPAAFFTALKASVGTVHLFGAIGEEQNLGFLYLSEGFQDRKEMMGLFFIESMRKEIHFLDRLFNRLNEMTFLDTRDLWFPISPKGPDDLFDLEGRGFRIFEEAFEVKDRPLGIGKEIAGNQNLVDNPRLRIDGDRNSDQSSGGL